MTYTSKYYSGLMVEVDQDGWDELDKKLADLPAKLQKKVVQGAFKKAIVPVLTQERSNAPMESGYLKRSLRGIVVKNRATGEWVAYVGILIKLSGQQKIWAQREFKFQKSLTKEGLGAYGGDLRAAGRLVRPFYVKWDEFGFVDRAGKHHPGTHFVERAANSTAGEAQDLFADAFARGIEQIWQES